MKFNSTKNKLKKLNILNAELLQIADNQENRNNNAVFNKNINIPNNFLFNKNAVFSTDWEVIESISDSFYYTKHKLWTIEFDKFDIRMLPHLDVKILYRTTGGNVEDTINQFPYTNKYFQIFDIPNESNDNYKQVKMLVGLYVSKTGVDFNYDVKLNIIFTNPREYR